MANDRRGAATIRLDPEEGTRVWKALLVVTVVRSKASTAVAVESTRMIIAQTLALPVGCWLKGVSVTCALSR